MAQGILEAMITLQKSPNTGAFSLDGAEGGNKPHRKPFNYQSVTCQFHV
jgi:hypothetical protein